jgi:protein-disulfide isomerase
MSNRQARREQSRTTRSSRAARPPGRPAGPSQRRPSRGGGGGLVSPGFIVGLGVLVVVLLVVVAVVALNSGGGDPGLVRAIENTRVPTELADRAKVGRPEAPLKVQVFADFQCPFCLRFTAEDEPTILEEYVAQGKVQLEYKHFPILGPESVSAALASECAADQGKFWEYHKQLFMERGRGALNEPHNQGRFSQNKLKTLADRAGLDRSQFDPCLENAEHLAKVQDDERTARSLGITGTPTFAMNGVPFGDPGGPEQWKQLLDGAIAGLNASPTPGSNATPQPTQGQATPQATATP